MLGARTNSNGSTLGGLNTAHVGPTALTPLWPATSQDSVSDYYQRRNSNSRVRVRGADSKASSADVPQELHVGDAVKTDKSEPSSRQ